MAKLNLRVRFALILGLLLLAVFGIRAAILYKQERERVFEQSEELVQLITAHGFASRIYVSETLRPRLSELIEDEFVIEGMSSTFVSRSIVEILQRELPDYSFRQTALNPLNLDSIANEQEAEIIRLFQENRDLIEWQGQVERDGQSYLAYMRPVVVEERCLACHGDPNNAPPELVERFGSTHGYNWQPNTVASAFSISVPIDTILNQVQAIFLREVVIDLLIIALVFTVVYIFFERLIDRRLRVFQGGVEQITRGDWNYRIPLVATDEIGYLAGAFNQLINQLQQQQLNLENMVQERTQALETSIDISSRLTTILNVDELLQYVINRLKTGFNYYYTSIYLIDDETGDLIMREGFGEMGRKMKKQRHRLAAGEGFVGGVASINEPFFSNNVSDLLNFEPNPLLPDTRSELAVPLRKGDLVLGVLDIHSDKLDFFSEEDVPLAQSIANQIAVAIDNARLLVRTQNALKQVGVLNARLTQEAWQKFGDDIVTSGYRYKGGDQSEIIPDSSAWLPPMKQAAAQKKLISQIQPANGGNTEAEMAVPLILRGEVIGVLGVKRQENINWSDEEISAVETVANQVARALENARLSQEQEKTIYQLKEVDRMKSDFLTSMSHELRTPLNSIIGFADILLQGIDGPLSDYAVTDVTAIHNSGKHLLALINDILDLSKIEAGRMELACITLSVPDLFEEVASSVSSLLKNKPVELIQQIAPDVPDIWADPLRLSQVIINLVSNALKFTDKGTITIAAEMYFEQETHFYVRDTGLGIPEDKLDMVFDRFQQVDSRNSRKYQGTGMGLAISRQLVELHGGRMWLDSVEGEGSTFHFTLPITMNN